uniref:Uncharacterized protein n=1 Tax=Spongospora subterranea TaxID=70186 RepID=A0A0H5QQP5_9EUKA|eukprot:CRZ03932.1 hypothetical protein [Spongospora subterranea]
MVAFLVVVNFQDLIPCAAPETLNTIMVHSSSVTPLLGLIHSAAQQTLIIILEPFQLASHYQGLIPSVAAGTQIMVMVSHLLMMLIHLGLMNHSRHLRRIRHQREILIIGKHFNMVMDFLTPDAISFSFLFSFHLKLFLARFLGCRDSELVVVR